MNKSLTQKEELNQIVMADLLARTINIEHKLNRLLDSTLESSSELTYKGHKDQAFGHITYAQHGEDLLIVSIFHQLNIKKPSYIDIGAHHPLNISNTALLYARGSRGVNIEANPNLISNFIQLRPDDINLNIGLSDFNGEMIFYMIDDFSGRNTFDKKTADDFVRSHPEFSIRAKKSISVMTLDDVILKYLGGKFPDFLSIDVEGLDEKILKASKINANDGPKIICVEICSGDNTNVSSCITDLLKDRGYIPYFKTLGNILYVDKISLETLT
jgi:FkbM family methyltransferase